MDPTLGLPIAIGVLLFVSTALVVRLLMVIVVDLGRWMARRRTARKDPENP